MDNYRTSEEYIEYQKYAESQEKVLMKSTLLWLLKEKEIDADPATNNQALYAQLRKVMPETEFASKCSHLGVTAYTWQKKFDITEEQIEYLERNGYISVTGVIGLRSEGDGYFTVPLYSISDYFRLSVKDVKEYLKHFKSGRW